MDDSRRERLKRAAKGRSLIPRARAFLRAALGEEADGLEFAPLDVSDEVWAMFEERWKEAQGPGVSKAGRFFQESTDKRAVLDYISRVRNHFDDDVTMFLFLPAWHQHGAITVPAGLLFGRMGQLIRVDQEDVWASDRSGSIGTVFEAFSSGSEIVYRFLAWTKQGGRASIPRT